MIITTVGFSITGFILFLLLRFQEKNTSQKIGIAVILLWFLRFLVITLKSLIDTPSFSFLHIIDQSWFFLDGVLLFLYSKSLFKGYHFSLKKEIWHFLPFLIGSVLTIITLSTLSSQGLYEILHKIQQDALKNEQNHLNLSDYLFILFIILHNLIYIALTYRKLRRHESYLSNNYSKTNKINLTWLLRLIKIWIVLLIIPLLTHFINTIFPVFDFSIVGVIVLVLSIISSIYLGVKLLDQKYVFMNIPSSTSIDVTDESNILDRFNQLEAYMVEHKPYLNESLSLEDLSASFGEKRNKLSQIINIGADKNFFEYINSYRIESIKKKLIYSDEQIIQIAYKNGFSSKSTFNHVFKKLVGCTPSKYRKDKK